jgi:hypothetical protein
MAEIPKSNGAAKSPVADAKAASPTTPVKSPVAKVAVEGTRWRTRPWRPWPVFGSKKWWIESSEMVNFHWISPSEMMMKC